MPILNCTRCGYKTERLSNIKTHLTKKKVCEPLYANVDRGELLAHLGTLDGKDTFKTLALTQTKLVPFNEIQDPEAFTMQMQKDNIKLKHENIKLKKEVANLTSKLTVGTTNNITNNITQHIHIHNYGNEDTSYITNDFLAQIVAQVRDSIPSVIRAIHFDPQHPENHNVKMPNKRDKYMVVRRNNEWRHEDRRDVLVSLVSKGFGFINENCGDKVISRVTSHKQATFGTMMAQVGTEQETGENGETYEEMCSRMEKMLLNIKANIIKPSPSP